MRAKRIKTVSHAVRDINAAIAWYSDLLGMPKPQVTVNEGDGVKMATFRVGDGYIQLMEPINNKGGIQKFLDERGEGLHHITIQVDNTQEVREKLVKQGVRIVDSHAKEGDPMRSFWVHPLAGKGVLIEFSIRD
ncbi:MAG: VOC family protein [Chloroflexi bacterium]|nr:VOC family protein [Chloroflexota bacterium]